MAVSSVTMQTTFDLANTTLSDSADGPIATHLADADDPLIPPTPDAGPQPDSAQSPPV